MARERILNTKLLWCLGSRALTRNGVYWLVQHALKANSDNEFFATMNRQDGRSCESSIGSI